MQSTNTTKKKSKRIFYFDALRALAIITVILFHIFLVIGNSVASEYPNFTLKWLLTDILGTSFRFGVALFLMLSGALSLGRDWKIKPFLSKRIPRITLPFLFWGFILSMCFVGLAYLYPGYSKSLTDFSIPSILNFMKLAYLSQAPFFGPYWFFWMILGTYLIMPILNKWLRFADLKEAEYFLVIWLVTCFFQYTVRFEFPVTLTYFTGAIGMVVLGYYLRHTKRKIFNNPYVAIIGWIVSVGLLVAFSYHLSSPSSFEYFNSIFYFYFKPQMAFFDRYSILVVIEVACVFLFFKNYSKLNIHSKILNNPDGIFRKSLSSIAKYSYGIYLIHDFILLGVLDSFLPPIPLGLRTIILFFGTLFLSWFILAVLNRVPYLNQIIGAK